MRYSTQQAAVKNGRRVHTKKFNLTAFSIHLQRKLQTRFIYTPNKSIEKYKLLTKHYEQIHLQK